MKTRREALKMISLATGSVMLGSMVTGGVFAGTDNAVANGRREGLSLAVCKARSGGMCRSQLQGVSRGKTSLHVW